MSRHPKRTPIAWAWRRGWRRLAELVKSWRAARRAQKTTTTGATTGRRVTNRRQTRCPSCQLYVRRLCVQRPDPCGVCPACCPGHETRPAEQDGGLFTTSVEKA